jgi:hypothetical protein
MLSHMRKLMASKVVTIAAVKLKGAYRAAVVVHTKFYRRNLLSLS